MNFQSKFDQQGNPVIQYEVVRPFTLVSGRTCPEVRLGFCVFAERPGLPVVILHPALTGSPRAWVPGKPSQGDGWLSSSIGRGKWLDPSLFTIICVDPLGGNGFSSSATELAQFNDSLEFADGIAIIAHVLRARGVDEIHSVIGGSIGGGQAIEWLFQNQIKVKKIFDISGSACRTRTTAEFFQLHADLLRAQPEKIADIEKRLSSHCSDLTGVTEAFDYVFSIVLKNLSELATNYSEVQALKIARQIGFLRFVTPEFYQTRLNLYLEESSSEEEALVRLSSWIEHQGDIFPGRFSAPALAQLCAMDARAPLRPPEIVAEAIALKGIDLIGFSVQGDILFPHDLQKNFYELVKACLPRAEQARVGFISVEDRVNGHDHFLTEHFLKSSEELKRRIG